MKMPTIGIFVFISRENFMLSWVEHEKKFYDLRASVFSRNRFLEKFEQKFYVCDFQCDLWVTEWGKGGTIKALTWTHLYSLFWSIRGDSF